MRALRSKLIPQLIPIVVELMRQDPDDDISDEALVSNAIGIWSEIQEQATELAAQTIQAEREIDEMDSEPDQP